MTRYLGTAIGAACLAAWLQTSATAAEFPFDGNWSVVLVCPDTTDKNGVVKGYEYDFPVSIHQGVLRGEYREPGTPASVVYAGQVSDDGGLEIKASGQTGSAEYSVGRVARGTPYGYTLRGKLVGATGEATRTRIRPCTATFTRT